MALGKVQNIITVVYVFYENEKPGIDEVTIRTNSKLHLISFISFCAIIFSAPRILTDVHSNICRQTSCDQPDVNSQQKRKISFIHSKFSFICMLYKIKDAVNCGFYHMKLPFIFNYDLGYCIIHIDLLVILYSFNWFHSGLHRYQ